MPGGHRGQDLVTGHAKPQQRVVAPHWRFTVGAWATELGLDLQAVAGALDFFDARQLADRGIQQVERFAGFERDLDLSALAVAERVGIDVAGDQPHPLEVRERAGDDQQHRAHAGQHHREFPPPNQWQAGIQRGDQQDRQAPGNADAQDEERALDHGVCLFPT